MSKSKTQTNKEDVKENVTEKPKTNSEDVKDEAPAEKPATKTPSVRKGAHIIVGYKLTKEEVERFELTQQIGAQGAIITSDPVTIGKMLEGEISVDDIVSAAAEVEVTIGRLITDDIENGNVIKVYTF